MQIVVILFWIDLELNCCWGRNPNLQAINPKVKGVIAKVEKLEDCPQDLLRFAKEYDLPIILMKATDR